MVKAHQIGASMKIIGLSDILDYSHSYNRAPQNIISR